MQKIPPQTMIDKQTYIRENYQHHTQREMAQVLGCTKQSVSQHCRRMQLPIEERDYITLRAKRQINYQQTYTERNSAQQKSDNMKRLYKRAQRELLWGLRRTNNIRVNLQTHKATKARYYLCWKYGYSVNPQDSYQLIRTPLTHPTPWEKVFTKRYKITFVDENNEQG